MVPAVTLQDPAGVVPGKSGPALVGQPGFSSDYNFSAIVQDPEPVHTLFELERLDIRLPAQERMDCARAPKRPNLIGIDVKRSDKCRTQESVPTGELNDYDLRFCKSPSPAGRRTRDTVDTAVFGRTTPTPPCQGHSGNCTLSLVSLRQAPRFSLRAGDSSPRPAPGAQNAGQVQWCLLSLAGVCELFSCLSCS